MRNGSVVPGLAWSVAGAFAASLSAAPAQEESSETRRSLIGRAQVRLSTDVASMDLKSGPVEPGAFRTGETVECEYLDRKLEGGTPKFACRLPDGDELKVKYGGTNGEVYAEVVSTRLLWALGFPADRIYSVRVVCRKCPDRVGGTLRANGDHVLDPAAVERKFPGRELTDTWHWDELDQIDETSGGAPAADRDALRLLAVFIQHSDSKPVQQRIVCADASSENTRCETPLMMLNDVGITFGRANLFNEGTRGSVNLNEWSRLPVWLDPGTCTGRLSGSFTGTLKNPRISEAGRQRLADLLMQLSDQQIHDMFAAARVQLRPRVPDNGRSDYPSIQEWVNAFKQKRAQIVDHRCAA